MSVTKMAPEIMMTPLITIFFVIPGEAVPEATPAPDKKALMEDQNLFPNSVENKAPGPAPAVDPLVEPIPLRENEDHWDTVHISPVIITKDVDWSFRKYKSPDQSWKFSAGHIPSF